jgi:hypothetical protein
MPLLTGKYGLMMKRPVYGFGIRHAFNDIRSKANPVLSQFGIRLPNLNKPLDVASQWLINNVKLTGKGLSTPGGGLLDIPKSLLGLGFAGPGVSKPMGYGLSTPGTTGGLSYASLAQKPKLNKKSKKLLKNLMAMHK